MGDMVLLKPDVTGSKTLGVKGALNHKEFGNRRIRPELIEIRFSPSLVAMR